jgi:hypothetical protein
MKTNLSKHPEFKLVYEDSLKNKWYTYVNPLDIDAVRGIRAERAERFSKMMVTEQELKLAFAECRTAAKENDAMKVYSIIMELEHRLKFICEENSVLDMAGIFFLLEDEDPKQVLDSVLDKKQKIWQEDRECRGFFLRSGLSLIKHLENIPMQDLTTFMEKTVEQAERLYMHIPKPIDR